MKINFLIKILCLSTLFLASCSEKEKEQLNYSISGTHTFDIRDEWHPISKSETRNEIKGTLLLENLEKQNNHKQITRRDSSTTSKMLGNEEIIVNRKIISTVLKRDTFYLYEESNDYYSFIYNSQSQSQILNIKQFGDSITYEINGIYSDTIKINCKQQTTANRIALFAIENKLLKNIHEEIKNNASR